MDNAGKKKQVTVFGVLLVLGGWYVSHNDADIAAHITSCPPIFFAALGATAILFGIGILISVYLMDSTKSRST